MTQTRLTVATLFLLCAPPVMAQDITIDQLVAIAIERAPELRAARTEIAAAAGGRLQAGLRPNPDVMASQQQPLSGGTHLTTIGLEWPLDLFRRPARIAAAERASDAATLSVRDRERTLAFAVRQHAGRLLAARRALDIMNEALTTARRVRDLLEQRVTEGEAPKLEANVAAVEMFRVEAERAVAAGEVEATTYELRAVAGLPPDAPLTLSDSLEALVRGDRAASQPSAPATSSIDARTDIREAGARVALADAHLEAARREGQFDMALAGSYSHMRFGFDQRGFDRAGRQVPIQGTFQDFTIGAKVTLPFRNHNQGAVATAEAVRSGAQALLDARQRAARGERDAAAARDRQAQQAVELYASNIRELARQNVDVFLEAYDLGRYTLAELLAEQRRYLDVEAAYTAMLARAYEARVALARARGDAQ